MKIKRKYINFDSININIFSNLNLNILEEILYSQILKNFLKPSIKFYDINSDLEKIKNNKPHFISIIFWEIHNILPTSINNLKKMKPKEINILSEKLIHQMNFFLSNIKGNKAIFFNEFTNYYLKKDKVLYEKTNILVKKLNNYLKIQSKNLKNLNVVNLNHPLLKQNYNLSGFKMTKTIYNYDFFSFYSKLIAPKISYLFGRIKKVLILDCDNTLWKGIIGEEKINYSLSNKDGKYFFYAQRFFKLLTKKGAIICLCSKNNYSDVDRVLRKNNKILLRNKDITLKKINWSDKVNNIINIKKKLNLGFDSFLFLDDSDFELESVKKYIPEVECLKVPKNLSNYHKVLFEIDCYFNFLASNKKNKTQEYKKYFKIETYRNKFKDIDEYIKSLKIEIINKINSKSDIQRAVELCQKTNQFNFTTKRYTENDIKNMIIDPSFDVHTFSVKDIFGNSGITALAIIKKKNNFIELDTFLMSCRIMGRKIESSILKFIFMKYKNSYDEIISFYSQTEKNSNLKNFFTNYFFKVMNKNKKQIKYQSRLKSKKILNMNTFSNIYEK